MLDKTLLLLGEAAPLLVSKAARRESCIGVVSRCAHLLSFTRLCRIIRHLGSGIVWQPSLYLLAHQNDSGAILSAGQGVIFRSQIGGVIVRL